jgi:hypothetical protein
MYKNNAKYFNRTGQVSSWSESVIFTISNDSEKTLFASDQNRKFIKPFYCNFAT